MTSPTWADGATPTNILWDVVDNNGVASLNGFSNASATSSITQNGSPTGTVDSVSIDPSGRIVASFGAGRTVTVGQIALANFNNPQGLVKLGTNRFGESESSGIVERRRRRHGRPRHADRQRARAVERGHRDRSSRR